MDALKRKFHVCFVVVVGTSQPSRQTWRTKGSTWSWPYHGTSRLGFHIIMLFSVKKRVWTCPFFQGKHGRQNYPVFGKFNSYSFFMLLCVGVRLFVLIYLDLPSVKTFVPFHPKNLPKGRHFTYLEGRNL